MKLSLYPQIPRVLVCGGRDFADVAAFHDAMDNLDALYDFETVIHGGASGADFLADEWAKLRERKTMVFAVSKSDWRKWGHWAGPRRNQHMLTTSKPNLLIAFPGGKGTADMCRRAKLDGVPVISPLEFGFNIDTLKDIEPQFWNLKLV